MANNYDDDDYDEDDEDDEDSENLRSLKNKRMVKFGSNTFLEGHIPSSAMCEATNVTYKQLNDWINWGAKFTTQALRPGRGNRRRFAMRDVYAIRCMGLAASYGAHKHILKAVSEWWAHQEGCPENRYMVLFWNEKGVCVSGTMRPDEQWVQTTEDPRGYITHAEAFFLIDLCAMQGHVHYWIHAWYDRVRPPDMWEPEVR